MNYYCSYILRAKEGSFVIFFADFPEATTQGDTLQECLEMGEDAFNITIEEYIRERKHMPAPSSIEETRKKAFLQIEEDKDLVDTSFEPFLQLYKAPDVSQKPVRVTVSFSKATLDTIDIKAEKLGMTRSGFLAKCALAY